MTDTDRPDTIADAVDALTNPIQVRERYEKWHGNNRKTHIHEHRMPSLLDQLDRAKMPGEVYVEDQDGHIHRKPGSCPPARLEAINLALAIEAFAADNVWRARLPVREGTASNLRALVGARLTSEHADQIFRKLCSYLTQARVVAGWQRPAWRPDAPCPACDRKGLRVRLDTSYAVCVECEQGWDPKTIGILAEHVRSTTQRPVLA